MTNGLVALVESRTAITDLIGLNPTRFFPRIIPQGTDTYPAATFRMIDTDPNETFDGGSTYDFGNIDIHCYGKKIPGNPQGGYEMAKGLWEVMRRELEHQSGTFDGVIISDIWFMPSGLEDYIEELELYTKQLELRIGYVRTTL